MTPQSNESAKNRLTWFLSMVVVGSIIIPALIVATIQITYRFQDQINVRSEQEATELMAVLRKGLSPPLWSFVPENAQDLINGVALNEGVNRVTVFDAVDDIFVEYQRPDYIDEADAVRLRDVILHDELVIGSIEIEYSRNPARQIASEDSRQVFFIIIAQVMFSLTVILWVINRRVTRPLNYLKDIAFQVAAKNFDTQIKTSYDDEFADLAHELDNMKVALKEAFENLEDRVEQRTKDLTRVNTELTDTVQNLEKAKDSLVQTEKLAALGSLVAGVSHELNTPIGNGRVMSSSLFESAKQLKAAFESGTMTRSQFEQSLEEILQGASLIERNLLKAINLVQSFKQIAVDRTSDQRRKFHLNEFILEIDSTMHHIFKSKPFELEIQLDEDVELNSFPGVLSQVIANLINNALMHGFDDRTSGTITVKTQLLSQKIKITVTDDGVGMNKEVQRRIFEPFFTTKLGKGGSGLGMHIVHNLITGALGGELALQSQPGKGTSVEVIIPKIAPEQVSADRAVVS